MVNQDNRDQRSVTAHVKGSLVDRWPDLFLSSRCFPSFHPLFSLVSILSTTARLVSSRSDDTLVSSSSPTNFAAFKRLVIRKRKSGTARNRDAVKTKCRYASVSTRHAPPSKYTKVRCPGFRGTLEYCSCYASVLRFFLQLRSFSRISLARKPTRIRSRGERNFNRIQCMV